MHVFIACAGTSSRFNTGKDAKWQCKHSLILPTPTKDSIISRIITQITFGLIDGDIPFPFFSHILVNDNNKEEILNTLRVGEKSIISLYDSKENPRGTLNTIEFVLKYKVPFMAEKLPIIFVLGDVVFYWKDLYSIFNSDTNKDIEFFSDKKGFYGEIFAFRINTEKGLEIIINALSRDFIASYRGKEHLLISGKNYKGYPTLDGKLGDLYYHLNCFDVYDKTILSRTEDVDDEKKYIEVCALIRSGYFDDIRISEES